MGGYIVNGTVVYALDLIPDSWFDIISLTYWSYPLAPFHTQEFASVSLKKTYICSTLKGVWELSQIILTMGFYWAIYLTIQPNLILWL